ncbi:hypothetical protein I4U23_000969 [Adineta vaga]|nr:hypothetical protein I4U23_000969 [Adineta vaga]
MPSEQEAIKVLPTDVDMNGITDAFNDPVQIFRMLDKNNDGRITKEDLQVLLEQFGIHGMASSVLSRYIFKQLDANNNGSIDSSDLINVGNLLWNLYQQKQNLANN